MLPKNLKYDKNYSWIKVDGDIAEVGIIEPAAKKVKEFVFIALPDKGSMIKRGETYASLEAVKWSGHLPSPVSGKIIEVNEQLFDTPSNINSSPYSSWIMRVKLSNRKELEELMSSEEAEKFYEIKNEKVRA
ncbi:MAG: glycine cleavage system protein GcvH [Candidatus Woesearchaeota archaeon]